MARLNVPGHSRPRCVPGGGSDAPRHGVASIGRLLEWVHLTLTTPELHTT
jgi:hypothetical protein